VGLLDLWSWDDVENFIQEAHDRNVLVALAGSIKKEDLPPIRDLGADVVGIRGAACEKSDRQGKIVKERVQELVKYITRCGTAQNSISSSITPKY
jgi:uncharacterized protein (UPF0264 family)